jgi:hypothetical protein
MKKYTLRIEQDTHFESPAEWDGDAVQLLVAHRHIEFGHHNFSSAAKCDAKRDELKAEGKVIFPLYAYHHGGVTLSITPFSCSWDSGQIGWVAVDPSQMGGAADYEHTAKSCLIDWNNYLMGNVWGYVVEDQNGDPYDSCWGYYGDPDKSGCRKDGEAVLKRAQEGAAAAASDQCAIYEAARLAFIHMPDKIGELMDISEDEVQRLKDQCLMRLSDGEAVLR